MTCEVLNRSCYICTRKLRTIRKQTFSNRTERLCTLGWDALACGGQESAGVEPRVDAAMRCRAVALAAAWLVRAQDLGPMLGFTCFLADFVRATGERFPLDRSRYVELKCPRECFDGRRERRAQEVQQKCTQATIWWVSTRACCKRILLHDYSFCLQSSFHQHWHRKSSC